VLKGIFAAEGFGEVGYGAPVVKPSVAKIDGDTATIDDCQDTSHTGRKKLSNGKATTVGLSRDHATTTMTRGSDGRWRVEAVDYPDDKC